MGNVRSTEVVRDEDIWWTNGAGQETQAEQEHSMEISGMETINTENYRKTISETTFSSDRERRKKEMQEDLIKFKRELAQKHESRRQLIIERKKEMADIRDELMREKTENNRLRKLLDRNRSTEINNSSESSQGDKLYNAITMNSIKEENEDLRNEVEKLKLALGEKQMIVEKNKELRISLAEMQKELQSVNTQVISFEKERIDYQEHVTALKDIIKVSKEMLRIRENQIDELKKKIKTIEELLASKEVNILSDDLRQEYERQLRNIRDLRNLYEDRQRADRREKENLHSIVDDLKKKIEDEETKNGELTERVNELEEDNSKKYDKIINLESNFGLAKAECRELHAEMNIINQLFSQILISFNNDQDIDLTNMIKTLEENHDLLTNIVINDDSGETSALPKVLLDLIKQVNESNKKDNKDDEPTENEKDEPDKVEKLDIIEEVEENQLPGMHQLNSPEEIVENLPKVWRVLIELLSHQSPPNNEITEKKGETDSHCYKSVETPTGLRKVLSVSKTFIRLKSLILEKKGLEKEMTRLKQLNTHLEGRLSDQEKRLVLVSSELSKTWNFVGKMQKQHQQLHTQEKILRYELAQKRKLLTELKEELEYCRQKWQQARKQNSSTEEQWKQLRSEFASRKTSVNDNSVESGFSDDKSSSDEEDANFREKFKETKKESIPPCDISRNDDSPNKNQDDSFSESPAGINESHQPGVGSSSKLLDIKDFASGENLKPKDDIHVEETHFRQDNATPTLNSDSSIDKNSSVENFSECNDAHGRSLISIDSLNSTSTEKTDVDAEDEVDRCNHQICENAEEEIRLSTIDDSPIPNIKNNISEENKEHAEIQNSTEKLKSRPEHMQNLLGNNENLSVNVGDGICHENQEYTGIQHSTENFMCFSSISSNQSENAEHIQNVSGNNENLSVPEQKGMCKEIKECAVNQDSTENLNSFPSISSNQPENTGHIQNILENYETLAVSEQNDICIENNVIQEFTQHLDGLPSISSNQSENAEHIENVSRNNENLSVAEQKDICKEIKECAVNQDSTENFNGFPSISSNQPENAGHIQNVSGNNENLSVPEQKGMSKEIKECAVNQDSTENLNSFPSISSNQPENTGHIQNILENYGTLAVSEQNDICIENNVIQEFTQHLDGLPSISSNQSENAEHIQNVSRNNENLSVAEQKDICKEIKECAVNQYFTENFNGFPSISSNQPENAGHIQNVSGNNENLSVAEHKDISKEIKECAVNQDSTENLNGFPSISSNQSENAEHIQNLLGNNENLSVSLSEDSCATTSQNQENENSEQPTASYKNPVEAASEFAARREARMKRLEEQCNELFFSVAKTSLRGMVMAHKLDNLHEMYGEGSQPANQETPLTQETEETADCESSPVTDPSENNENNQE